MLPVNLNKLAENVEREYLITALRQTNGLIGKAGNLLGLNLRQTRYLVKKFGINKYDYFNSHTPKNVVRG